LFAIGRLDDYELLKKEIGESAIIMRGMEARIQERMKIFRGVNSLQVSPRYDDRRVFGHR
jgi:hypothetical protein